MSYVHETHHARKYKFDRFKFTVPEFIELYKSKAEKWVQEENRRRADSVSEMRDPKLSKRELKENEKQIKEDWDLWYRPVTVADYSHECGWNCRHNIVINPADGTFDIEVRSEMNYMDKLQKGLKRKQEKEEEHETQETAGTAD